MNLCPLLRALFHCVLYKFNLMNRYLILILVGLCSFTAFQLASTAIECTTTETQVECAARAAELVS